MNPWPSRVRIVEVGPRDGLQNEPNPVSVETRVELIRALADAGLREIEAGSFVSPRWVPQMAGTPQVLAALDRSSGVSYPVLVPNERGWADAREAGVDHIAIFTAASESFCRRNTNCSIDESLDRFAAFVPEALEMGVRVRGYLSTVVGCPYEGPVDPARVADVAARLIDLGCEEISLGDTIGVGTPASVARMLEAVLARVLVERVAVHFHDTWGQALANICEALRFGVTVVDAAVAGLGGCPYAPGAGGNVATEDVVYLMNGLGIATHVDLDALARAGWAICDALGHAPSSKVSIALRAACGRT
ncbi:MAG: hydroxymethylglutaryl-CoA lyase [Deltaproteobacteria bacterium]|nr:hydroxymethylglutaryl-CoA lyase [Deltaproteobacteria bacterium]